MTQQAERPEKLYLDELTAVDPSRFVRDVGAALAASDLSWADRVRVRRDLEFLIFETRGSRRPEVLSLLVRCVCDVLRRGGLTGFRSLLAPPEPTQW